MIAAPLKLPAAPNARSGGIDSGNVEPLHRAEVIRGGRGRMRSGRGRRST
jgi:hypothetical protein